MRLAARPTYDRRSDGIMGFSEIASPPDFDAGQVVPTIVQQVLREPGEPLGAAVRRRMEAHFGRRLDRVRIHTGPRATASADAVAARAYAVGRHIVFARGEYRPETAAGQWLLAHELTHVLQQSLADIPRSGHVAFAAGESVFEWEADRLADLVVRGPVPRHGRRIPRRIRRCPLALYRSNFAPPCDWMIDPVAAVLGRIAHAVIEAHYRSVMGPIRRHYEDFFDGDGKNAYFEFLGANNPHFRPRVPEAKEEAGLQFPDIISHKPDRKEYYEIKRDSDRGKSDGQLKLDNLQTFYTAPENNLPYVRGEKYGPKIPKNGLDTLDSVVNKAIASNILDAFIENLSGVMSERVRTLCKPRIFFRWKLFQHGLIIYRLGARVDCQELQDDPIVMKWILLAFAGAADPKLWPLLVRTQTHIANIDFPAELRTIWPMMLKQITETLAAPRLTAQGYLLLAERDLFDFLRNRYIFAPGHLWHQLVLDSLTINRVPGAHIAAVPADKAVNLYYRGTYVALSIDCLAFSVILGGAGVAVGLAETTVPLQITLDTTLPLQMGMGTAGATGIGVEAGSGVLTVEGAGVPAVSETVVAQNFQAAAMQNAAAAQSTAATMFILAYFGTATVGIKDAQAGTQPVFAADKLSTLRAFPIGFVKSQGPFGLGARVEVLSTVVSPPPSRDLYYIGSFTLDTPPWKEDAETKT
jgi:hypothetical protein